MDDVESGDENWLALQTRPAAVELFFHPIRAAARQKMGLGTVGEGNIHSASQDGAVMLRSRDRAADLVKVPLFTETPSGRADQARALHQPHWNTFGSFLPRRAGPLWWCHGAEQHALTQPGSEKPLNLVLGFTSSFLAAAGQPEGLGRGRWTGRRPGTCGGLL